MPTWATRAQPPAATGTARSPLDLTLDPASLRKRVTIRAGAAALAIDEHRLVLRTYLRKTEVPWTEILGFEPRFDGVGAGGSGGHLVAITRSGPVELPATKRSVADLRYMQALLEAYLRRAHGTIPPR